MRRLLTRFADEVDGSAALFDAAGKPIASAPDRALPEAVVDTARRVRLGSYRSVVERDGHDQLAAFAISGEPEAPTLALAGSALDRFTSEPRRTDPLRVLALTWQAQHAHERSRRVEAANDQVGEAVSHLLMDGGLATAHRTAEALRELVAKANADIGRISAGISTVLPLRD
ncbi:hypothetical protein E1181_16930 [Saccharopolyspora terrae]|uniref:ANTAR domain-containing protein n=1 Tax=Saccharopolyspora terrae TaxID=2530384 RepID=A0A4R4VWD2_9PSEU|nr:hypothetical protein [Saccharopolyspora terrae]TDD04730.1 hypothetical protein E1181_16930 [Saccharopolyspora terrae]